jgi:transposase
MAQREVVLTDSQRQQLLHLRDHAPKPYLRERAAALLKIADGSAASLVARQGLLRPRKPDTVSAWLERFQAAGIDGLTVRPGRGRKPAFSPSPRHH